MKAGVVYPQIELGGDTRAVKAFAQAAEDLGYDHIVIYDHVLGAVHEGREPKLSTACEVIFGAQPLSSIRAYQPYNRAI
jgi:hypothetical protein